MSEKKIKLEIRNGYKKIFFYWHLRRLLIKIKLIANSFFNFQETIEGSEHATIPIHDGD